MHQPAQAQAGDEQQGLLLGEPSIAAAVPSRSWGVRLLAVFVVLLLVPLASFHTRQPTKPPPRPHPSPPRHPSTPVQSNSTQPAAPTLHVFIAFSPTETEERRSWESALGNLFPTSVCTLVNSTTDPAPHLADLPGFSEVLPLSTLATKKLGQWHTLQRVLEAVGRLDDNQPALILEADVRVVVGIEKLLGALVGLLPVDWEVLFAGSCFDKLPDPGKSVRSAVVPAVFPSTSPMCNHAVVVHPQSARRLHGLLADFPQCYLGLSLDCSSPRASTSGPCLVGCSTHERDGKDVLVSRLVKRRLVSAFTVWPQVAVQPWMDNSLVAQLAPESRGNGLENKKKKEW